MSYQDDVTSDPHPVGDWQPHRGPMILVLGILSLVFAGIILGPIAWILGRNDLKEMEAGRMDPAGRDNTNVGRICGMIGTLLHGTSLVLGVFCCFAYFGMMGAFFGLASSSKPMPPASTPAPTMAEMKVAEPGTPVPNALPQPRAPRGVPGKTMVDLIPLIDPRRDAVQGKWLVVDGALHCNDIGFVPRIQIPYRPPEEYDVIVTFSQPVPRNGISVIMPKREGDGSFFWLVGDNGGQGFRLSTELPTRGKLLGPVKPNTVHTTVVRVRRDTVGCNLDDKELARHVLGVGDLTCDEWRQIPNTNRIAVACDDPTVFHYIRVIEITGAGTKGR